MNPFKYRLESDADGQGPAERAYDFLRRIVGEDDFSGTGTEQGRRRAWQKLFFWLNRRGLKIEGPMLKRELKTRVALNPGAEHQVWYDPGTDRVIKLLHAEAVDLGIHPGIYLRNLLRGNRLLGDDRILAGYVNVGEGNQLVTTQGFVPGRYGKVVEIEAAFHRKGFFWNAEKVGWSNETGVLIIDAGPKNVLTLETHPGSVTVIPIDVHIELATEGEEFPFRENSSSETDQEASGSDCQKETAVVRKGSGMGTQSDAARRRVQLSKEEKIRIAHALRAEGQRNKD